MNSGDNEITGTIENWRTFKTFTEARPRIRGDIYNDQKGRYEDGKNIITSPVVGDLSTKKQGDIVDTENSTYYLGKPAKKDNAP